GTGINNDGSRKIGFTAPSIKGQEALFREVRSTAEVEAESIGFVECHGTATPLGDPVEVAALTRAFDTDKRNYCALGSVKSNFGHTDSAAGVAGFIKAVLALYHKQIPPTLHFKKANPKLDMANGPFYVNTELKEWENGSYPLRAAVNSLGLGGTNAHVILEEAPEQEEASEPGRAYQLVLLSAKTTTALDAGTGGLARYLEKHPGTNLADAAYTLQVGRSAMGNRRAFVSHGKEELLKQLSDPEAALIQPFFAGDKEKPLVFMFSGQGSQYVNMGLDLYKSEESFREDIDNAFAILKKQINKDFKYILYPENAAEEKDAEEKIHELYYTQPVKFIFEFALARLLMSWGLKPHAMVGHSFGEYVTAALAGVYTLEDALKLVMIRGEEYRKTQPGQMLSVSLSEDELRPLIPAGVSLAAVNTGGLCLVSGPVEAVEAFEKKLEGDKIDTLKLKVRAGGHSELIDPVLETFRQRLSTITFNKPKIPYISGVTGTWITVEEATDPAYWTRHLREPVRFADALNTLFETPDSIFMQVGPGKGLTNFVNYYKDMGEQPNALTVNMVRHHKDPMPDDCYLLNQVGRLWSYGKTIDRDGFYGDEERNRCRLPGYPFESQPYWIDLDPFESLAELGGPTRGKKPHIEDWFYVPSWKTTLPQATEQPEDETAARPWLVFMDPEIRGAHLAVTLELGGQELIVVHQGTAFEKKGELEYRIDPVDENQYEELFKELKTSGKIPSTIIHTWNLSHREETQDDMHWNESVQDNGYYSLLSIARAIGRQGIDEEIKMEIIANGLHTISGEPLEYPEKATLIGPVKNIPQEYPNITCRLVDIIIPEPRSYAEKQVTRQLINEFQTPQTREQIIAYRGNRRLEQTYEAVSLKHSDAVPVCFRQEGVYLIIGGLGGVGLVLASYLASTLKAKLVLTSRAGLPPREEWPAYLAKTEDIKDKTREKIEKVMALEQQGAGVIVAAVDVADEVAMRKVVTEAVERFGRINGLIHSAFIPDGTVIDQRTRETSEKTFAAKIKGTMNLDRIFREREPLDFYMLCSSLASVLGPVGQVGYTAANAFQDAFAYHRTARSEGETPTVTVNWCGWAEVGGAKDFVDRMAQEIEMDKEEALEAALLSEEGVEAFLRVMASGASHVLVSTEELSLLTTHLNTSENAGLQEVLNNRQGGLTKLKRPQLSNEYIAARSRLEELLATIWQDLFGYETVGVQDNFFELGGDSLKAMTVSSRLHKEINKKIPISAFFNAPTIEGLAQFVESEKEQMQPDVIPKAAEKELYPLAPVQVPLFNQYMKNPKNTYLNVTICLALAGDFNIDIFEQTFKKLIERHDSYRASFMIKDGLPMQKIHEKVDFRIETIESPGASEEKVQELIQAFARPFDLAKAPLFRAALIDTGNDNGVLVTDTHQLIIDGTTAGLFVDEFMNLFMGNELPAVAVQYRDYAQWQHDRMESGLYETSVQYWLEQFKEPVKPLALPTDYPRPVEKNFDGRPLAFPLEEFTYFQLQDLAKETGTTMFMLWSAVISILLHKYSGQEDIVMGSRLANRPHSDLERVIGKFSNTLGFRSRPEPGKTFRQYLEEVKEISLGAFKHIEYPFELLSDRLVFTSEEERTTLFDVVFVYNNMETSKKVMEGTGAGLSLFGAERIKIPYDIYFQANEFRDYVVGMIQYPTSLFKEESIELMIENLLNIFGTVAENPDIPIAEIKR
ncbi:MAG: SDR family NAD(P)-dependent oxidoreductase, partial [bacterium]|nr:SDR family NAD(P)-dependent oxidoreductase [bacterium]